MDVLLLLLAPVVLFFSTEPLNPDRTGAPVLELDF